MIWTPPKPRIVQPRCEMCGRLKWSMGTNMAAGVICCCEKALPCESCPDKTMPTALALTFSGVTVCPCQDCPGCGPFGADVSDEFVLAEGKTLDTTFVLEQGGFYGCSYGYSEDSFFIRRRWWGLGCDSGNILDEDMHVVAVRAEFGSSHVPDALSVCISSEGRRLFACCIPFETCNTTHSGSNVLPSGDCGGLPEDPDDSCKACSWQLSEVWGHGGSVEVQPA